MSRCAECGADGRYEEMWRALREWLEKRVEPDAVPRRVWADELARDTLAWMDARERGEEDKR